MNATSKWGTKHAPNSAATEPIMGKTTGFDFNSELLRKYRDEIIAKDRQMAELKKEINTLRTLERRQDRAIKELDVEKGNLPRLVQTITEENR